MLSKHCFLSNASTRQRLLSVVDIIIAQIDYIVNSLLIIEILENFLNLIEQRETSKQSAEHYWQIQQLDGQYGEIFNIALRCYNAPNDTTRCKRVSIDT